MAGETLYVEHLRLRVPGLGAEEAGRLGEDVAEGIAAGLPAGGRSMNLGALDLTVLLPTGTPRDRLALLIAEAVLGRLG